jgi:antitoxin MazE
MKTRIIRIGNSQGVRIPLLEKSRIEKEVELNAEPGRIVIRNKPPRSGWEDAFREMAAHGHDALLDADAPRLTYWEEVEWRW